ncbi:hypothetical protein PMIN03_002442 [Paraphaeosphaeria minitans]
MRAGCMQQLVAPTQRWDLTYVGMGPVACCLLSVALLSVVCPLPARPPVADVQTQAQAQANSLPCAVQLRPASSSVVHNPPDCGRFLQRQTATPSTPLAMDLPSQRLLHSASWMAHHAPRTTHHAPAIDSAIIGATGRLRAARG